MPPFRIFKPLMGSSFCPPSKGRSPPSRCDNNPTPPVAAWIHNSAFGVRLARQCCSPRCGMVVLHPLYSGLNDDGNTKHKSRRLYREPASLIRDGHQSAQYPFKIERLSRSCLSDRWWGFHSRLAVVFVLVPCFGTFVIRDPCLAGSDLCCSWPKSSLILSKGRRAYPGEG